MANTQNTEVAEKKSTAVAAYDDSLLSAGTGLEEATTDDMLSLYTSTSTYVPTTK